MDPYPFLRGTVNVKHKASAGLKRHTVMKQDEYPIRGTASTRYKSLHVSACQVPTQENSIRIPSIPSQEKKATTISFPKADDVDCVDDIDHALRQRHWVKHQSALASKTCDSAEKLQTAHSEQEHNIQPQQQTNSIPTTLPSTHLRSRKNSTKNVRCLIVDFTFQPENLEIETGDSITWLLASKSDVACEHQIIARSFLPDLCFEGPIMGGAFGATQFTKTITEPGQLTFYCDVVPEMGGNIIVRRPEERKKVPEECFDLPLTSSVNDASPAATIRPEKMNEMAEGAQLPVSIPLLGVHQSIKKGIQSRASGNRVKLESTNDNIPDTPNRNGPSSVVSYPPEGEIKRREDNEFGSSLEKENRTYSDDGVFKCLPCKPSPDEPPSLGSLRLQKKRRKKKKKKEKKSTHAAACKDNTHDNSAGNIVRKGCLICISPSSGQSITSMWDESSIPLHDTATQTSEISKQIATNGSLQRLSCQHQRSPYLSRPPPKERSQEQPSDTADLIGKLVIGNDDDEETISHFHNSGEEGLVVPHVNPEAGSTRVRRAQDSSNGGLTSYPPTVGVKCGPVRTYNTKEESDIGHDNDMWCHLEPSKNPEPHSKVEVEEGALFRKTITTADGDNEIDNDDRGEERHSNNISNFKTSSSKACHSPATTTFSVAASMSSSSSWWPASSSRLILPNQAMLPSYHEYHCKENKHITFGTFDQQHTDPISGLPPSKFEHEVVSFLRLRWEKAQFLSVIESI